MDANQIIEDLVKFDALAVTYEAEGLGAQVIGEPITVVALEDVKRVVKDLVNLRSK